MLGLLLYPFYLGLHIVLIVRLIKLISNLNVKHKKLWSYISVLIILLPLSIMIGFILPNGFIKRAFNAIGSYWLGFSLYLFLLWFISLLIRIKDLGNLKSSIACLIVIPILTAVIGIYAIATAKNVVLTHYDVDINKQANVDHMRIALVSDIHLGYNIGVSHIEKMVNIINDNDVDIVVIAGDIFDNDYDAIEDDETLISLFNQIKTKYGAYSCWGNHDVDENIFMGFTFKRDDCRCDERMEEFLKKANVNLLYESNVEIEGINFYGRADRHKIGYGKNTRNDIKEIVSSLDMHKPLILIDHQPSDLDYVAQNGVDLMLSGHTHDGQIFPLNLTSKLIWENSTGILQKENMTSIVSSGLGLYGPNMRLATKAEVCVIDVNFR